MEEEDIGNFNNEGFSQAQRVFENVLTDLKENLKENLTIKELNRLIKSSKRLRKASQLLEEEAKEQRQHLKKVIGKPTQKIYSHNSLRVASKKAQDQEINLNQQIHLDSQRQEIPSKIQPKDQQIEKKDQMIEDSSNIEQQDISEEANLKIVEAAADEELNKAIASKLDPAWLKRELEGANQEAGQKIFSYALHGLSKQLSEQAFGLFGTVRRKIQIYLEKFDVANIVESSKWFKKNVDLFYLEQKHLELVREDLMFACNFEPKNIKYTGSVFHQPNTISRLSRPDDRLTLIEHLMDENKLSVYKFPSLINYRDGFIRLPVSNVLQFELFSQESQGQRSIVIHTSNSSVLLTRFNISTLMSSQQQKDKFINGVAKISFQPLQDYFATLSVDRRKIEVFDEKGFSALVQEFPKDSSPIVSFCLSIDTDFLTLLCYLNNKTVRLTKYLLPLNEPLNKATVDFATDVYLENTTLPSERDEPDCYMLGQNEFYIQFLNSLYLIKTEDIQLGTLIHDARTLIDVLVFGNVIFRVYNNDITVQLFDERKVYNEKTIFMAEHEKKIKKALISIVNAESYKIEMIDSSLLYYTFFVDISNPKRI